jgi:hypothetical protein
MKTFKIVNNNNEVISKHKSIVLANTRLKEIDCVQHTLYASDTGWLSGNEEAYQGYNHSILPILPEEKKK